MLKMVEDPKTGFLEQPNFAEAFTAQRKLLMLELLEKNEN